MSVPREFKHLSTWKHLGLYLATQLGYRAGKFDSRWLRSQNGHEESFFTQKWQDGAYASIRFRLLLLQVYYARAASCRRCLISEELIYWPLDPHIRVSAA
jgi:hypothetical protein